MDLFENEKGALRFPVFFAIIDCEDPIRARRSLMGAQRFQGKVAVVTGGNSEIGPGVPRASGSVSIGTAAIALLIGGSVSTVVYDLPRSEQKCRVITGVGRQISGVRDSVCGPSFAMAVSRATLT